MFATWLLSAVLLVVLLVGMIGVLLGIMTVAVYQVFKGE